MTTAQSTHHAQHGYILFEIVLALAIFIGGVVALQEALNAGMENAVMLNRENNIRLGLRSFIEETRRKEIADMATESRDERLEVTYSSTVEEMSVKNKDGTMLTDLYVLHAKASYGEEKNAREETVDLYVYKPQVTQGKDSSGSATDSSTGASAAGAGAPSGGAAASGVPSSTGGQTRPSSGGGQTRPSASSSPTPSATPGRIGK